jgi:hypothetical protein
MNASDSAKKRFGVKLFATSRQNFAAVHLTARRWPCDHKKDCLAPTEIMDDQLWKTG